jgi:hypothetical protein
MAASISIGDTANHPYRTRRAVSFSLLRSRRWAVRTVAVAATLFGAASGAFAVAPAAGAVNWAPVNSTDFPDPSVLYVPASAGQPAVYYGFATQNTTNAGPTVNIQEATSSDGIHWTPSNSDALPTADIGSWAKPGDTWAPSVTTYTNGANATVYVMYYTATERSSGYQCIGMATASVPSGPYVDTSSSPVECQLGDGGSIDPNVFTDPKTGTAWLLWKNDGNRFNPPMHTFIWSVPLTSSLVPTGAAPQQLLQDNQGWQGGVVEGPDMVYEPATGGGGGGTYVLFYSGGVYGTNTYAVGWATCTNGPGQPCQDSTTDNPLLTTAPGMSGPGGPFVYTIAGSGQQEMAFAAWEGTTIGYLSCGVRPMYLATLGLNPDGTPASLSPAVPAASPAVGPTCPQPPAPPPGYWQVASDGGVFTFGSAQFYGSTGSLHLNKPVVGMAATPDGRGYWLVASDGGIFAYGDAGFYGSTGSIRLNQPIIGMISTLDGGGYWLIASDGGIFAFGDAPFYGSAANDGLTAPITGAAPSFLGGGYWMVDSNGQIYSFGDARYEGAPPGAPGGYWVTGMAGTHSSNGYWLVSANGNVAHFGDAAPYGSAYGLGLAAPVVGMAVTHNGAGYWLQGRDGGIFTYGDAPFFGSMGGLPLNAPMVGIAAT